MCYSAWECVCQAVWELDSLSGNLQREGGPERIHTPIVNPSDTMQTRSDTLLVSPTAPSKKKLEVYTKAVEADELELGPIDLEPAQCSWTLVQPQLTFRGETLNGVTGPPFIGSRRSKENFQRR